MILNWQSCKSTELKVENKPALCRRFTDFVSLMAGADVQENCMEIGKSNQCWIWIGREVGCRKRIERRLLAIIFPAKEHFCFPRRNVTTVPSRKIKYKLLSSLELPPEQSSYLSRSLLLAPAELCAANYGLTIIIHISRCRFAIIESRVLPIRATPHRP